MNHSDTIEWQAHARLTTAIAAIHDATTLLLRSHHAGTLRSLSEDLGAHRNALLRIDDALSRYIASSHRED
jgi:hypothetical protein